MLFPDFNKLNVETQYTMLNHVTKTYGKTIRYVFEIRYIRIEKPPPPTTCSTNNTSLRTSTAKHVLGNCERMLVS